MKIRSQLKTLYNYWGGSSSLCKRSDSGTENLWCDYGNLRNAKDWPIRGSNILSPGYPQFDTSTRWPNTIVDAWLHSNTALNYACSRYISSEVKSIVLHIFLGGKD